MTHSSIGKKVDCASLPPHRFPPVTSFWGQIIHFLEHDQNSRSGPKLFPYMLPHIPTCLSHTSSNPPTSTSLFYLPPIGCLPSLPVWASFPESLVSYLWLSSARTGNWAVSLKYAVSRTATMPSDLRGNLWNVGSLSTITVGQFWARITFQFDCMGIYYTPTVCRAITRCSTVWTDDLACLHMKRLAKEITYM
jgi:hypothetical protein